MLVICGSGRGGVGASERASNKTEERKVQATKVRKR